ncbi:MAG TPA: TonB-dependent receptor [Nevskiaceae bacterium]|nr:TonB-dependent receptor [Nevskiaceae bacterium]
MKVHLGLVALLVSCVALAEESAPAPEATPQPYPETVPVPSSDKAPPPATDAPQEKYKFEEVVVTAQKVKQSARDVPISMSVMSDKFVAEKGIVDIVQAMQYVPNVKIASGGFFAAPQARGFSFNNNNKAFESPLGIAFDGIPYTNTTYFNSGLFDIQRVEVLRGPQGTTFGKNTTAGLVSIVTADPTPNWSGVVMGQYGQVGRKHAEAAIAGPIVSDVVEFRVAYIYDKRDGFVKNTAKDESPDAIDPMRGYDHKGYRAKLKFPDLFGTDLKLSYESVDLDNTGAGVELWHIYPAVQAVVRKYDADADFTLNNYTASEDGQDFRYAHTNTAVAEWNVPLGGWTFTALGGHSELKETMAVDVDFTSVPGLPATARDRFPTTTVEGRIKAPTLDGLFGIGGDTLGHTEFLTGVFWQHRQIRDSAFRFVLHDGPLLELTAAAETGNSSESLDPAVLSTLLNIIGGPLNPIELMAHDEVFNQIYDQTGSVVAFFQQTDWQFLPHWKLLLGARYSKEKKEGFWDLHFDQPGAAANPLATALGLQEFSDVRSQSENQFMPKVSLNWQPTKQLSLFAHWARGFKGGGFNAFAYRDIPEELEYKPETTDEIGFDLKATFFGGRFRPNLSFYRMDARDFQVLGREKPPVAGNPQDQMCESTGTGSNVCFPPSTVIGLGTTRVFNAEKAYAQGVEGDLNWMVGGGFNLFATLGYNDTKYTKFTQNECAADNTATYCDATGRPFAFAPKWDTTLTPSWLISLPWGLTLTPSFTVIYMGTQLLDTDLDERKRQGGFVKYNATIALANLGQGWTLQVIGNNLGDKRTSVRYGDALANIFVSVPEPRREVFAQLRYVF